MDIFADGPPKLKGALQEQTTQLWTYIDRLADRVNAGWLVKNMDIFADKPAKLRGDTNEQVSQLYSYLCGLVDFLNMLEIPQGGITPDGTLYIEDADIHDVSEYAKAAVYDEDLAPENIRHDVEVLGVEGTFDSDYLTLTLVSIDKSGYTWEIGPFTFELEDEELVEAEEPTLMVSGEIVVYAFRDFGTYNAPVGTEELDGSVEMSNVTMEVLE